jgi:hypothetical protein
MCGEVTFCVQAHNTVYCRWCCGRGTLDGKRGGRLEDGRQMKEGFNKENREEGSLERRKAKTKQHSLGIK